MSPLTPRQPRPVPAGSRAAALAQVRQAVAVAAPEAGARVGLLGGGRIGLQLDLPSGKVLSLAWSPLGLRVADRTPLTASAEAVLKRLEAALGAMANTTVPAGSRQIAPSAEPASRTTLILAIDEADIRAGVDHLRDLAGDVDLDLRTKVISPEQGEKARHAALQALEDGTVALVVIVMTNVASLPAPERAAWLACLNKAPAAGRLALLVGDHTGQLRLLGRATEAARVSLGLPPSMAPARGMEDASADGSDDALPDPMSGLRDGPKPR